MKTAILTAIAIATSTIACPTVAPAAQIDLKAAKAAVKSAKAARAAVAVKTACGGASWYSLRSRTASGEMMNPAAMTAAHKTLPLGSVVKVTNLRNGRSVVVTINDRGPFIRGRLIDLSKGAAAKLDFVHSGVARVKMEAANSMGVGGGCA